MNANMMKAAVIKKYGGPEEFEYMEVLKPIPKDNEVLIKIINASVSSGDVKIRSLNEKPIFVFMMKLMFGFKRPNDGILGSQFAGTIVDIGKSVSKFKKGDDVYGITGMAMSCYAQFVCIKQSAVMVKKPATVSFEDAASISFGAMTALHILRKGNIKKNDAVLIYGASGSVGTYAIQIAKHFGAVVTAVCSKKNFEGVKSLGADRCIDYHTEDFTKGAQKYSVVFDAVWKISAKQAKKVLAPEGKYLSVSTPTSETLEKLEYLNSMLENNEIRTVIDKTYPLSKMKEAHIYVETGRKVGNVIINVEH